jgi:peptidyl-Lys metalloendopeptidase
MKLTHTVAASAVLAGAIAAAVAAPPTARTNPLKVSIVAATGKAATSWARWT